MSCQLIELREITKDDKLLFFYKSIRNNVLFIDNSTLYNYVFYMNNLHQLMNKRQAYILDKYKDTNTEPTTIDYYNLYDNPKYAYEIVELYKYIQFYTKDIKKFWNKYNPIMNKMII